MELLLLILFIVAVTVIGWAFVGYLLIIGVYRAYEYMNDEDRY